MMENVDIIVILETLELIYMQVIEKPWQVCGVPLAIHVKTYNKISKKT